MEDETRREEERRGEERSGRRKGEEIFGKPAAAEVEKYTQAGICVQLLTETKYTHK